MGKTRDLFNKIRDAKGNFHAKIGIIKHKIVRDLIETEDIKQGWQEYIEKLYKNVLHEPDKHDDVIIHLHADIWNEKSSKDSESITMNKASGGDGIPVELFQIQKVLYSICQQIWKTQQWPQDQKR